MMPEIIGAGRQAPDPTLIRINRLAKRILVETRDVTITFTDGKPETFKDVDFMEAQGQFLLMLFDKGNQIIRLPIHRISKVEETLKPGNQ